MIKNAIAVNKSVRIFSAAGSIVRVQVPVSVTPSVSVGSLKCCCESSSAS